MPIHPPTFTTFDGLMVLQLKSLGKSFTVIGGKLKEPSSKPVVFSSFVTLTIQDIIPCI